MNNERVFIEKKEDFNVEAKLLKEDLKTYLGIEGLEDVRIINVYDLIGGSSKDKEELISKILYEKQVDDLFYDIDIRDNERYFRLKDVDGQFNQREDSINEMIRFALGKEDFYVSHSRLFIFTGLDEKDFARVKKYFINPVELEEIDLARVVERSYFIKDGDVEILEGFNALDEKGLEGFKDTYSIAMDVEDLEFCQKYFKSEDREPSITEIKLIDTYWSDHCRHTTFMTEITDIEIEEGGYEGIIRKTLEDYIASREFVYGETDRPICLMDLATINQKEVKKKGLLDDKEETDEVNAASIEIDVDVDGKTERWLLMFKNETHNHPTEIEPFGGAATCLGGAIRDPLSGRSYVYQAMRITGSGDPRTPFEETREGKLPQRKITQTAKEGYSSYGYEIGAATGYVREIYDEGYVAKRMEVGALVAAAPKENVTRGQAEAGDVIILVGGRTGRDGLGGAVGSSKKHTEKSLESSGAEVQKGNPKIERKIVRLFRKPELSKMIKVCNDFGAGGVSVAIGELADGVHIDLDRVTLKYPGLDGTEIALSESQERMAVVVARENSDDFLEHCQEEDLEARVVAKVTSDKTLRMLWRGKEIVSIARDFLDTNGIRKKNKVKVLQPVGENKNLETKKDFLENLRDLNIASQKGLVEGFDSSVGRGTVLSPVGGKNKITPSEGMVAKIPVLNGDTETCSIMTYGFDPKITKWSSFHGGYYAVLESVARLVALGGSYEKIRLSFQEYFERIGKEPAKWGKPFAALLGAFKLQKALDIAAIGGKDSMSGSFEDLHVPPTIISFAVSHDKLKNIISPEFKAIGSEVGVIEFARDEDGLLDLELVKKSYAKVKDLVNRGKIQAMSSVKYGGIARSIAEMAMGNSIGFKFEDEDNIYEANYGGLVIEFKEGSEDLEGLPYRLLGRTIEEEKVILADREYEIKDLIKAYGETLEEIFPVTRSVEAKEVKTYRGDYKTRTLETKDRPRVLIPVVSGSHGEYDLKLAFERAGAEVEIYVIKTFTKEIFDKSLEEFAEKLSNSQILALPDGKIMGNEPEAGGKLWRLIFNYEPVKEATLRHIYDENRLVLGIGAGLQALIKLGLIECGKIKDIDDLREDSLFVTNNKNSKFISQIVDVELKSNLSPWLSLMEPGESFTTSISTKEGRIIAGNMERLIEKGQVALVYKENLTGSDYAIDGLTSPCGKVFGCLSSIERISEDIYRNIDKKGISTIFEAGVNYFK